MQQNELYELAHLIDSDNFEKLPATKKILVLKKLNEALTVIRQTVGRID